MTTPGEPSLLAPDELSPFEVVCPAGASRFVLTGDHAGRRLPRALGDLGVAPAELARHIAWDIGVAALGRALSARLDAFLILQTYSRLAIDVNRPPGSPESIVTRSEQTDIPGNRALTSAARAVREEALFHPYHARLRTELDARTTAGRMPALIALHSFTPVYMGCARPFHAGVLHQRDARLARALHARLAEDAALVVGDNEPYALSDETDYTVPVHAERRGLPYVELEIRQDLLSTPEGVDSWAARLAVLLDRAWTDVFPS